MLYREIIAVCSQIHTKHINTLCGQNVELFKIKPCGTCSNHRALKVCRNKLFEWRMFITPNKCLVKLLLSSFCCFEPFHFECRRNCCYLSPWPDCCYPVVMGLHYCVSKSPIESSWPHSVFRRLILCSWKTPSTALYSHVAPHSKVIFSCLQIRLPHFA